MDDPVSVKTGPKTPKKLPKHIGFIMGGGAAWAAAKKYDVSEGYKAGATVLKDITLAAVGMGIPCVSAFMFSADEWGSPQSELTGRMRAIIRFVEKYTADFMASDIKVVHLGAREGLPPAVLRALDDLIYLTEKCTSGTLALGINYGGQLEIVDATKKLLRERVDPFKLTTKDITASSYYPELPPADLIVRTGGEYRLNGFLLWQASNAQLMFIDKPWPDFTRINLQLILQQYSTT